MLTLQPETDVILDRGLESSESESQRTARRIGVPVWTGITALAAAGLFLQFTTYLNHDIAWVLYSTGWLLQGAEFGRDVIAANPPLIWYLSMPVVMVAEIIGAQTATVFRLFIALTTLVSIGWSGSLIYRSADPARRGVTLFLVAAAYVFFIDSFRDFGQREYITLLLCLPYAALAGCRLSGLNVRFAESLIVGLCAGIGVSLKPHFLAIPFCIELAAVLRTRRLTFPVRVETSAGTAAMLGYVLLVAGFAPAYVFETVPLVRQVYWGFNSDLIPLVVQVRYEILSLGLLAWVMLRTRIVSPIIWIFLATAGGFFLSYLAQQKGYTYHGFPFRGMAIIVLGLICGVCVSREHAKFKGHAFAGMVVGLALTLLLLISLGRTSN